MTHYKRLSGDQVYLSPLSVEDAVQITLWKNEPELLAYWDAVTSTSTLGKTQNDVEDMMNNGYEFAIVSTDENRIIGMGSITGVDHLNQSSFLWLAFGDLNHWSNGYGDEAVCLLLDYAYQILNIYNVTVWVIENQIIKLNSLKRCGFKVIGQRRELVITGTQKADLVYLDILLDEYNTMRSSIKSNSKIFSDIV